ncbi:amidophosphoribosyltransferase [Candidatus Margulisiibacteriota bacterium]
MCGLFGIYDNKRDGNEEAARLTYFALYSLQHRGQESAGISVSDGTSIKTYKQMGLVSRVFSEDILDSLTGWSALGQVRYSTTGSSQLHNAQPFEFKFNGGEKMVIAHNGNLVNFDLLCDQLDVTEPTSTSDTELMARILQNSKADTIEEAVLEMVKIIRGAYSVAILTKDKLIAFRDPHGIRPLCIGKLGEATIFTSETCALDIVGARHVREIEPGEMVVVTHEGLLSKTFTTHSDRAMCAFEYIYFARPDSNIYGKNLYKVRVNMGRNLAREHPVDADIVISVPDSGTPAAIGFSKESGIPFDDGLIKNRYVGRTFIQPSQAMRELGVKIKLNPIREIFENKRVVIVDDSIVRGTTSKNIIKIIREAGAREVHMRVSSPPVMCPCFYGIDTATKSELIAANMSVEEIRKHLNVDSLGYLSIKGMVGAINLPHKDLDLACFNNVYPIKIPEAVQELKLVFK